MLIYRFFILVVLCLLLGGCYFNTNNEIDKPSGGEFPNIPGFTPNHNIPNNDFPNNIPNNNNGNNGNIIVDEPSGEVDNEIQENPDDVIIETDYQITCISGTVDGYIENKETITFTNIKEDSVYLISGSFDGNIVIDCSDNYKFELQFSNFTITSSLINPITILSGSKVQLTAKKDTNNFVYDYREAIDSSDENSYSSAIYSLVDLELGGKGNLEIYSKNNNGIHTKDDLKVKNLNLNVVCMDNALKGNDSVTIESGNIKLVAKSGDGIKTTNSHINSNDNQKGTITILGGTLDIYSACDAIDSSYDVVVSGTDTVVNIYTDKYSGYSDEVTAVTKNFYYIRYSNTSYNYSVKYINSSTNEFVWENATYASQSNRNYYYKVNKPAGYDKLEVYMYASNQAQGQSNNYYKKYTMSINDNYDTLSISSRSGCSWTNYSTSQPGGGFGGMQEGNSDKGDHSTKGIKADNQITINDGNIKINSYDDSIHAKSSITLENGSTSMGNVVINGGNLTLYSNDDGLHADGHLYINGGNINVTNSYEGAEGYNITVNGGYIGVVSKDDGFNATNSSGSAITFNGGKVYICATGDGIDSNSRQSYGAITFNGSDIVVISNSNMNSAIDSDGGYSYKSGRVVAMMPSGGMSSETTHCSNFTSIGKKINTSLTLNNYLTVTVDSEVVNVTKLPTTISSALVVYLGSSSASASSLSTTSYALDTFGVYWK